MNQLEVAFSGITDYRDIRRITHLLTDIIGLAVIGTIAGCLCYEDIEDFGNTHYEWLKKYLKLFNGIPSHDTIERLFENIHPKEFSTCFVAWVSATFPLLDEEFLHIDGKSNKGSRDKSNDKKMLHSVSVFAGNNHLSLAQLKVADKSNEMVAIPLLIDTLDVKDKTITIDAMGCQKTIARVIADKKAHYILAVKANQLALLEEIETAFTLSPISSKSTTKEKGHGREEERTCDVISDLHFIDQQQHWSGLSRVIRLSSKRTIKGETSKETRYFISNKAQESDFFKRAIRSHWGIENSLHWVLDVLFEEDGCRKNKENAAENFNLIRKMGLNILRHYKEDKISLRRRVLKAAWSTDYLDKLLQNLVR